MRAYASFQSSILTPLREKAIFRRGYTTIALTLFPRDALVEGVRHYPRAFYPSSDGVRLRGVESTTLHYFADKQILMSKTVRPNCIMAFPRILRASNLSVPPPVTPSMPARRYTPP